MLVGVHHELLDARQDVVHDDLLLDALVQGLAEVAHLVGGGGADLGLAVLEKALKKENKIGETMSSLFNVTELLPGRPGQGRSW